MAAREQGGGEPVSGDAGPPDSHQGSNSRRGSVDITVTAPTIAHGLPIVDGEDASAASNGNTMGDHQSAGGDRDDGSVPIYPPTAARIHRLSSSGSLGGARRRGSQSSVQSSGWKIEPSTTADTDSLQRVSETSFVNPHASSGSGSNPLPFLNFDANKQAQSGYGGSGRSESVQYSMPSSASSYSSNAARGSVPGAAQARRYSNTGGGPSIGGSAGYGMRRSTDASIGRRTSDPGTCSLCRVVSLRMCVRASVSYTHLTLPTIA